MPDDLVAGVIGLRAALRDGLHDRIAGLLSSEEADATSERVETLLAEPVHPLPPDDRPAVPWPIW